ncbi:hypothetical protein F5Y15DRAFT_420245 [Xylariaceae sp. FL0016]|nr:hypothetical protein F5Y15DRAFT_420245 [Xylariaceae sp. FL0016]
MARSIFFSAISLLVLGACSAKAQTTSAYTDEKTGITFQGFSSDGYTFGIAVPETIGTDFIGQISANVTEGWAGASLTGSMANSLLIAAYPNGDSVMASLREASGYANPAAFNGTAALATIAKGTFVNDTAFTYTFVCKGCITSDSKSFNATEATPVFGYAMSSTALSDPASKNAALNYHDTFGGFGVDLDAAKSPDYATWAAMTTTTTTTTTATARSNRLGQLKRASIQERRSEMAAEEKRGGDIAEQQRTGAVAEERPQREIRETPGRLPIRPMWERGRIVAASDEYY